VIFEEEYKRFDPEMRTSIKKSAFDKLYKILVKLVEIQKIFAKEVPE